MQKLVKGLTFVSLLALSAPAFAEKQPNMHEALKHLDKAIAALQKATADKGGHRVAAIKLAQDARDEVKKGIEFDNKR